ncbi:hypothetical protein [Motilimonas eburnea]|uniref:hypothetical protein n=1 Tax=Motilimonas eburnea TaxID=1737488 RepID=UPI001E61747D|nr:hypothetical protein [Motilimonas eburnea]MCE2571691.1 hypothetical protein [Motilimonas eburnea]
MSIYLKLGRLAVTKGEVKFLCAPEDKKRNKSIAIYYFGDGTKVFIYKNGRQPISLLGPLDIPLMSQAISHAESLLDCWSDEQPTPHKVTIAA